MAPAPENGSSDGALIRRSDKLTRDNYKAKLDSKAARSVRKPNHLAAVNCGLLKKAIDKSKLIRSGVFFHEQELVRRRLMLLEMRKSEIWLDKVEKEKQARLVSVWQNSGVDAIERNGGKDDTLPRLERSNTYHGGENGGANSQSRSTRRGTTQSSGVGPVSSEDLSDRAKRMSHGTLLQNLKNVNFAYEKYASSRKIDFMNVEQTSHRSRGARDVTNLTKKQQLFMSKIHNLLIPTKLPEVKLMKPATPLTKKGRMYVNLPMLMTGGLASITDVTPAPELRHRPRNYLVEAEKEDTMYTWLGLDSQEMLDVMKGTDVTDDELEEDEKMMESAKRMSVLPGEILA